MNVFFCQPYENYDLNNLSERISKEMEVVEHYLNNIGVKDVKFLNSMDDYITMINWKSDLSLMLESKLVIFHKDWMKSKRCKMLMLACEEFEYPYIMLPQIYWS